MTDSNEILYELFKVMAPYGWRVRHVSNGICRPGTEYLLKMEAGGGFKYTVIRDLPFVALLLGGAYQRSLGRGFTVGWDVLTPGFRSTRVSLRRKLKGFAFSTTTKYQLISTVLRKYEARDG